MASSIRASIGPTIRNLLFATDYSACSNAALPYVRSIATLYGSTVHVVHVMPKEPLISESGVVLPDDQGQAQTEKLVRENMDRLTNSEFFKGITHAQVIETGEVWDVVSRLVDQLNADLIVLGTHGRHGLKDFVMGSVAEQIFRRATCPVLTVGPKVRDGVRSGKAPTILFATDFSPSSRHALDYALLFAHTMKASIVGVHVIKEGDARLVSGDEGVVTSIRGELASMMPEDPTLRSSVAVEIGTPADVIVEKAAELGATLIIMGAHRGASASAHTPWAIAHRVVCEAPCPVLTVRA